MDLIGSQGQGMPECSSVHVLIFRSIPVAFAMHISDFVQQESMSVNVSTFANDVGEAGRSWTKQWFGCPISHVPQQQLSTTDSRGRFERRGFRPSFVCSLKVLLSCIGWYFQLIQKLQSIDCLLQSRVLQRQCRLKICCTI